MPENPNLRPSKQVIVMRHDLSMRKGKIAAQAAHAAMAFLTRRIGQLRPVEGPPLGSLTAVQEEWLESSFRKICVYASNEQELLQIRDQSEAAGLEVHLVTDNGLTEFGGKPTRTCLCIGPDYDDVIDPITGHLPLY